MTHKISKRLNEIVDALPLKKGIRILEIGCGTGVAARAIASRIGSGHILAIDRSPKAIELAIKGSEIEISKGILAFRMAKIEYFELEAGERRFDLAFAIRVGALDGRHPEIEKQALFKIARALKTGGRLFIDGGDPLKEIDLQSFRTL